MQRSFLVLIACVFAFGCENAEQSGKANKADPSVAAKAASPNAAKTADDARTELQGRIDRVLGGVDINQEAVNLGSFRIEMIGYDIESVTITKLVPSFTSEGKPIENLFSATLTWTAKNQLRGKTESGSKSVLVGFSTNGDGKWSVN